MVISIVIAATVTLDWRVSAPVALLAAVGGFLNGLGALTSFAALEKGGKASIVIPIYLQRDEVPLALRAFYNTFAVSYYADVNAFTEWAPSFGKSGGPFFKTSDEAAFLSWLRLLLVREEGDRLYLDSGAPLRWFRAGARIEASGLPTFFGQISFRTESHADEQYVDAAVEIPAGFRAKEIALRVRHPAGRSMVGVELDGRPWSRFDVTKQLVFMGPETGVHKVRVLF